MILQELLLKCNSNAGKARLSVLLPGISSVVWPGDGNIPNMKGVLTLDF